MAIFLQQYKRREKRKTSLLVNSHSRTATASLVQRDGKRTGDGVSPGRRILISCTARRLTLAKRRWDITDCRLTGPKRMTMLDLRYAPRVRTLAGLALLLLPSPATYLISGLYASSGGASLGSDEAVARSTGTNGSPQHRQIPNRKQSPVRKFLPSLRQLRRFNPRLRLRPQRCHRPCCSNRQNRRKSSSAQASLQLTPIMPAWARFYTRWRRRAGCRFRGWGRMNASSEASGRGVPRRYYPICSMELHTIF